jgi:P4 family phage/plasmid primase-like protien
MPQEELDALTGFVELFPPHPHAHGRLEGLDEKKDKIQYTANRAATTSDYEHHLTAPQDEPRGIGMYPLRRGVCRWLCIDIDETGEVARYAADELVRWFEQQQIPAYLERSTRGKWHVFVFLETDVDGAVVAKAARAGKQQALCLGMKKVDRYPSAAGSGERAGQWVNLPYRGALADPDGYGTTFLMRDGVGIPIWEAAQVDRATEEAIRQLASTIPDDKPRPPLAVEGGEGLAMWEQLVPNLRELTPSARHEALVAAAGVGVSLGIPGEKIVDDLLPLKDPWAITRVRDWNSEVERAVAATEEKVALGQPVTGWPKLKSLGVPLPPLPEMPRMTLTPGSTPEPPPGQPPPIFDGELTIDAARRLVLASLQESGERVVYWERAESWWRYEHGVYRQVAKATVTRMIDRVLEAAGRKNVGEGKMRDILAKVSRTDRVAREDLELGPMELNVRNGILDLKSMTLRPHDPDLFTVTQAGAEWDENADCPQFRAFLERAVPIEQDRWALAQFAGLCLTGNTSFQRALLVPGLAGTGKGTFFRTLGKVLGGDGPTGLVAAMGMPDLEDGTPKLELLVGKRLLIISELPRQVDWLTFKRVSGEDSVNINPKFRPPYNARLCCKIAIQTNTKPHLNDDSTNASITRRLLPIEFNHTPENPDPNLEAKLTTQAELNGILWWAAEGLQSLLANGDFYETSSGALREMVASSNLVIQFLEDKCVSDPGGEIKAADLYAAYCEWCDAMNHRPVAGTRFAGDLRSAGRYHAWEIDKQRKRDGVYYTGVVLKGDIWS